MGEKIVALFYAGLESRVHMTRVMMNKMIKGVAKGMTMIKCAGQTNEILLSRRQGFVA